MTTPMPGREQHAAAAAPGSAHRGFDRILVVRLGSMGDILHSLPAVATLRRALPHARIDWVVEERWAELLCSRPELRGAPPSPEKPLVDVVHVVDTRAWRRSMTARQTRLAAGAIIRTLRDAHYDLALDLQGAIKSALLARLSQARTRIGFSRPREAAAGVLYTRRVIAQGRHIVEQNASLASAAVAMAGVAADFAPQFPLPCDPALDAWACGATRDLAARGFALMTPAAGWGAKCWPAERFAAVARALGETEGLPTLVNHGPGESDLARAVVEQSAGAARAVSCSIGELIALTRRARLFIGGDTGPTHLAAALGVPVVGIYGPTDPARNGPYGSSAVVLRSPRSQTSHARRRQPEAGLLEITPAAVVNASRQLLGAGSIRA